MMASVRSPRAWREGGSTKWDPIPLFLFFRFRQRHENFLSGKGPTMNGADLLRIVDLMHREKNISKEIIFEGIQAAVQLATEKHYGEEAGIAVTIDRETGLIHAQKGEEVIDPGLLGRIAAQSAKQVMIQKIRE